MLISDSFSRYFLFVQRSAVGGTCLELFDEDGTLRWGRQLAVLWPFVEGDGAGNTTPSQAHKELKRLEKVNYLNRKSNALQTLGIPTFYTMSARCI